MKYKARSYRKLQTLRLKIQSQEAETCKLLLEECHAGIYFLHLIVWGANWNEQQGQEFPADCMSMQWDLNQGKCNRL